MGFMRAGIPAQTVHRLILPSWWERRADGEGALMYRALWRVLPGKTWQKIIQLVVLGVAAVAGLFFFVFPLMAELLLVEESTLG